MSKETGNVRRVMLESPEIGAHFLFNIISREGQLSGMHAELQTMIEVFIRVAFRSIGGQVKCLDLCLMTRQPGRHQLAMMYA